MAAQAKSTQSKISPARRKLLGKVHIAKKQLGMDDETYRAILDARFGKTSSAKLRDPQLIDLIEHFKTLGFKHQPSGGKAPNGKNAVAVDRDRQIRKIRALWVSMYHLGILRDNSERALTAFARRVTGGRDVGIAQLPWLHGEAIYKVTEALKKMAEREAKVDWSAHRYSTKDGPVTVYRPRCRVLEAQWRLAADLGEVRIRDIGALSSFARGVAGQPNYCGHDQLSLEQQDLVIVELGRMIRRALKERGFATIQEWRKS
tara:strand:+ start:125 stop:904 length:780 start_codon:yes stop_codon:yes gene_type:complete